MAGAHPLYRSLVRLYPSEFRRQYADDLVAHYADLVADRGARAAWARTALDLTITVPRYHLEHVMTEQRSTTTLAITIGLLATAGLASAVTGLYPGLLLLVVAIALAIAQRSSLARALSTPDSNLRRRRLQTAAVLGAVFVASFVAFDQLIGDTWTIRETILTVIGTPAMFGAVGFLIAGLVTPRTPGYGQGAPAS